MSTLSSTGSTVVDERKLSIGNSCVSIMFERCGNTVILSWCPITIDGATPYYEAKCQYDTPIFTPQSTSKHFIPVTVNNVNQIGVCEISRGNGDCEILFRFYSSVDQATDWPESQSAINATTICYKLC
jgi:hypothetical protein